MNDTQMSRVPIRKLVERPWPILGETIEWTGKCFFNPELLKRNVKSESPGVLHARRPLLPLLNPDTAEVKPENTTITISAVLDYARPVYLAVVNGHSVIIKLHAMPENFNSQSPWDALKYVNKSSPLQLDVLREARAYERLEAHQGSLVPHNYGFYEYTRVGSKPCLMQVLEHVDGITSVSYSKSLTPDARSTGLHSLYDAYFETLIELHKVGVLHRQPTTHHVRLVKPLCAEQVNMVMFDYGGSDVIDFPGPIPGKSDWIVSLFSWIMPDLEATSRFMTEAAGPDLHILFRWMKSPRGKACLNRWFTFPLALSPDIRKPAWYRGGDQQAKTRKLKL